DKKGDSSWSINRCISTLSASDLSLSPNRRKRETTPTSTLRCSAPCSSPTPLLLLLLLLPLLLLESAAADKSPRAASRHRSIPCLSAKAFALRPRRLLASAAAAIACSAAA